MTSVNDVLEAVRSMRASLDVIEDFVLSVRKVIRNSHQEVINELEKEDDLEAVD